MTTLKTGKIYMITFLFAVLLITCWISLKCIMEAGRINFQVSELQEPSLAVINTRNSLRSTGMSNSFLENGRAQRFSVAYNPLVRLINSTGYDGININLTKNSIVTGLGSSGKIQIKILVENFTTLNIISLGFGKINLPYVPDIGLSFNSTGKFNLNPFIQQNPDYRIYGLGNVDIEGNLLAVSLDMSEGIKSRMSGDAKVSAYIKPEIYEKILLRK